MRILVLTSIYPQPDDDKTAGVTPVVHYFAKEWARQGHDVMVIHNANKFVLPLYLLPKKIRRKINSLFGIVYPEFRQRKPLYRTSDNVKIIRLPILKVIPQRDFFPSQIKNHFQRVIGILQQYDFTPDVILGHWENPQIQLLSLLKDVFHCCKTALVFHGAFYIRQSGFMRRNVRHIRNIDVIGARSKQEAGLVRDILKLPNEPFVCYSGIPDEFIQEPTTDKNLSDDELIEYLYVGRLIKRKHVDSILKALSQVYSRKNFFLRIIGTGDCEAELKALARQLQIEDRVVFYGLQPRHVVREYMRKAQCFTMVSSNEVFGLVYLEAMSQGCIVVASKGEGFDGIIVDGKNGFLCEPGNSDQLAKILRRINSLPKDGKEAIVVNAINTAARYTDYNVAKRYLENVFHSEVFNK
jgi:glycosyltransferase involved in cell wall biosynthesis